VTISTFHCAVVFTPVLNMMSARRMRLDAIAAAD